MGANQYNELTDFVALSNEVVFSLCEGDVAIIR